MAQQAKNEFYKDDDEMVMDFAAAVNEEAHDLQAAGADVIQLDDPGCATIRTPPSASPCRRSTARSRASRCRPSCTCASATRRWCRSDKPAGYSFLPQLADAPPQQISIEAAQPKLDLGILKDFAGKTIVLGVIDLGDQTVETPEQVALPHPRGA